MDETMKKRNAFIILLLAVSIYLTAYTVSAHMVTSHIIEINGKAYWRNAPAGSLWPWPNKKDVIGPMLLIELNETDSFIYNYLIKTYLLSIICALLWFLAIILIYKIAKSAKSTLPR